MENAQASDGFPTPEWSMHGIAAELTERLGNGFEFMGPGWYVAPTQTLLVTPLQADPPDSIKRHLSGLSALLQGLGLDDPPDRDARYVCYSWSTDPRPTIAALLKLEDQTEVPVPAELEAAWAAIEAMGSELKAWADARIATLAAEHGAVTLEVPPIGPCPTSFIKEQVDTNDAGIRSYTVGSYVLHVMTLEQQDLVLERTRKGEAGIPPYARVFAVGGLGLALSFSPPR